MNVFVVDIKSTGETKVYSTVQAVMNDLGAAGVGACADTIYRRNLFEGYENELVRIRKFVVVKTNDTKKVES